MFSVLKAFGVQNVIEPLLGQLLEPLGANASEVTDRILDFVANMQVCWVPSALPCCSIPS
jgi:membrane protein